MKSKVEFIPTNVNTKQPVVRVSVSLDYSFELVNLLNALNKDASIGVKQLRGQLASASGYWQEANKRKTF